MIGKPTIDAPSRFERSWIRVCSVLNEVQARFLAPKRALEIRRARVSRVSRASRLTEMSRSTNSRGLADLENPAALGRVRECQLRRLDDGRKRVDGSFPRIRARLERLLPETTAGDPKSHLGSTWKSTRSFADKLSQQVVPDSWMTVARYLREQEYGLHACRSRRSVSVHQPSGGRLLAIGGACSFSSRQDEGVGWQLSEFWTASAPGEEAERTSCL